jgi:hypothetical protein
VPHASFSLVEECSGVGDLMRGNAVLRRVRYRIARYQGMLEGSGMPIPGLHRIEGSVDLEGTRLPADVTGVMTLRLEDGRALGITVDGTDGRILEEGHGPGRGCSCC